MSAHRRFYNATFGFRDTADLTIETPSTAACACCGRPWSDVEQAGSVPYLYGHGFAKQYLCLTCYTPKIGSFDMLGQERINGQNGHPVAGKLGMLTGCGAVITADNRLFLALNNGFMRRFEHGRLAQQGYARQIRPLELLLDLYYRNELGKISDGIVFIENFGRKSLGLMGSLHVTTDIRELWANSADGARVTDLAALIDTAQWLRDHDYEVQAGKYSFWKPIASSARGNLDRDALQKWLDKTPGAAALIQCLPSDPHDRQGLHLKLPAILEAMT